MAIKLALFLLAFVLMVTRMGSSVEDVDNIETEELHHHPAKAPVQASVHAPTKAPAHAPKKAPVQAPAKAPIHAPTRAPLAYAPKKAPVQAPAKAPIRAPTKAPAHAPKKAPVHAPTKSPVHYPPAYAPVSFPRGCVAMCASHCNPIIPKMPCMRSCTSCCAKSKCVATRGLKKCSNWDQVMIHGRMIKCP